MAINSNIKSRHLKRLGVVASNHTCPFIQPFFYIKTGMYILFFRQTGVCSDIYLKKKGALEVMISIILKMQIYCCNPNFRLGIFLDSVDIFKLMLHYSPRLQNQCNCLSISIAQFLWLFVPLLFLEETIYRDPMSSVTFYCHPSQVKRNLSFEHSYSFVIYMDYRSIEHCSNVK